MKKLLLFLSVFALSSSSTAQGIFDKYERMNDVSAMIMDSNMFKMLGKIDLNNADSETQEYIRLIEQIKNIKVFATESLAIQTEMKSDVESYSKLQSLKKILVTSEGSKKVIVYSKPGSSATNVSELLLFLEEEKVNEKPEMILVSITGDIDMNQVFKLTRELDIPGSTIISQVQVE